MNPLWSNFFQKKLEEESIAYFLGTVAIFTELSKQDRILLESLVHVRTYKQNEIVFEEGSPGSGMYIIRQGRVVVTCRDSSSRELEITRLGPGDFFGETTLTSPAPRTATVRAVEPTELLGLFRADILELTKKRPALACKVLMGVTRIISERLHLVGKELTELQRDVSSGRSKEADA